MRVCVLVCVCALQTSGPLSQAALLSGTQQSNRKWSASRCETPAGSCAGLLCLSLRERERLFLNTLIAACPKAAAEGGGGVVGGSGSGPPDSGLRCLSVIATRLPWTPSIRASQSNMEDGSSFSAAPSCCSPGSLLQTVAELLRSWLRPSAHPTDRCRNKSHGGKKSLK